MTADTTRIDPSRDPTLDPVRRSWVESAGDAQTSFPIQNLPLGVFRRAGSAETFRIGTAIGREILDLAGAARSGMLGAAGAEVTEALQAPALNALAALGPAAWSRLRAATSDLLSIDVARLRDDRAARASLVVPQDASEFDVPMRIGDYTDFYCSIHHATNVGSMFRPDNPLMPNWKHLPVGYHGRASSIVISGRPIVRPRGQVCPVDGEPPIDAPSRLLDYELEVGAFVGPGNPLGSRLTAAEAEAHIFGLCLVNDWSARDVQKWEYQPLGPFNAKNFATTVSPWIVTMDALRPFRCALTARTADDPEPLPYLRHADGGASSAGVDITLEVLIASRAMRAQGMAPMLVSRGSFRDMWWSFAQMLAHHTSTGCNLRPGDLLGSGTVSGADAGSRGCLLERTWRGTEPLTLPDGSARTFLADGDEVIMRGFCRRDGWVTIGFGACRGEIIGPS